MKNSKEKTRFLHRSFEEEKGNVRQMLVSYKANLESFEIDDDGYQIVVSMVNPCDNVREVSQALEEVDFSEFLIRSVCYTTEGANYEIVPTTGETMNNFIWNYIERYLASYEDVEALAVAIGVLERIVEDLPQNVKNTFEDYTKLIIQ